MCAWSGKSWPISASGGSPCSWLMWLGVSLFHEPVHGPALLWREMYQEFAMAVGALLPAIVMGRF